MKKIACILAILMLGQAVPGSLKAATCSLASLVVLTSACCEADDAVDHSAPLESGHDHCATDCHCACCVVLYLAAAEVAMLPASTPAPSRLFIFSEPVAMDVDHLIWQPPRLG